MIQFKSIVLTAALYGHHAVSVSAAGCQPAYSSSATYASGDMVSASTTTDTVTTNSAGVSTTTTTTTTHNYRCVDGANSAYCSQDGFVPGTLHSGTAWTKESAACTGTAAVVSSSSTNTTTAASIPAAWSGGGCPGVFVAGTDYSAMAVVSVAKTGYTGVYQCATAPTNQFCGMAGYEPTDGLYMNVAWTALGSCTGTVAPTTSPSADTLTSVGGCPAVFDAAVEYDEGDKATVNGVVYQCKSSPASLFCSQPGYEPGETVGSGAVTTEYWREAWTILGSCSGTVTPTTSPVYVSLQDMGGCPAEWQLKISPDVYEEGDRVSADGLVYECKVWPYSGWCGQAGYEPNTNTATQDAWKSAWTVLGHCAGQITPTTSPTYDPLNVVGACGDEWVAGDITAYEEGDMVSVTISQSPERKVAYKCKSWPSNGYCGQYSPLALGGDLGWMLAGPCSGTIGPTAAPAFVALAEVGAGCPEEWSATETDYEAGDRVVLTVSDTPERKIVYECRAWPNSGYCGQGIGFKPATQYGSLAWTLKGSCDGTVAPTAAPAAYAGTCTYSRCRDAEVNQSCTAGSTGCSCLAGETQTASCVKAVTQNQCADTNVDLWSSTGDYFTGDVVRVGIKRFRCREWPNYLWCNSEAYMPMSEPNGIWSEAWTVDGNCGTNTPTSTPTQNPLP